MYDQSRLEECKEEISYNSLLAFTNNWVISIPCEIINHRKKSVNDIAARKVHLAGAIQFFLYLVISDKIRNVALIIYNIFSSIKNQADYFFAKNHIIGRFFQVYNCLKEITVIFLYFVVNNFVHSHIDTNTPISCPEVTPSIRKDIRKAFNSLAVWMSLVSLTLFRSSRTDILNCFNFKSWGVVVAVTYAAGAPNHPTLLLSCYC